jgi:hypothetical protein
MAVTRADIDEGHWSVLGLSLGLRLRIGWGPPGPSPYLTLSHKLKPKPNQRPRRAGLRATDMGSLICTVAGYELHVCI